MRTHVRGASRPRAREREERGERREKGREGGESESERQGSQIRSELERSGARLGQDLRPRFTGALIDAPLPFAISEHGLEHRLVHGRLVPAANTRGSEARHTAVYVCACVYQNLCRQPPSFLCPCAASSQPQQARGPSALPNQGAKTDAKNRQKSRPPREFSSALSHAQSKSASHVLVWRNRPGECPRRLIRDLSPRPCAVAHPGLTLFDRIALAGRPDFSMHHHLRHLPAAFL